MTTITIGRTSYHVVALVPAVNNPETRLHGCPRLIVQDFGDATFRGTVYLTRINDTWHYAGNNLGFTVDNANTVAAIDAVLHELKAVADVAGITDRYITIEALTEAKAKPAPEAPATPADRSFDAEYVARKRAELVSKAPTTPRPITDEMVATYPACQAVALAYVRTYKGFNSFVQDLAVALDRWGRLSIAQMRGVLNVMIAEDRAAQAPKPAPVFHVNLAEVPAPKPAEVAPAITGPITPVVPNGTYTVPINDAGEYRVIKLVDCPESFNKPAGTQIAKFQSGKDNESDYTGFAFVTGGNFGVWQKFRNARDITFALTKLITTGRHAEFGKLWAMESKRCFICGRKLTVPISKLAGIGPVCAANTGIDIDALAALNSTEETRKERAKAQADIDELFPE